MSKSLASNLPKKRYITAHPKNDILHDCTKDAIFQEYSRLSVYRGIGHLHAAIVQNIGNEVEPSNFFIRRCLEDRERLADAVPDLLRRFGVLDAEDHGLCDFDALRGNVAQKVLQSVSLTERNLIRQDLPHFRYKGMKVPPVGKTPTSRFLALLELDQLLRHTLRPGINGRWSPDTATLEHAKVLRSPVLLPVPLQNGVQLPPVVRVRRRVIFKQKPETRVELS